MKTKLLLKFTTLLLLCVACGDNDPVNFDKSALIENAVDNIIIPNYELFVNQSKQLDESAQAFVQNPSIDHLQALQNQWKASTKQWKMCEMFNFGPADDLSLGFDVDFWPTRPNLIENALGETTQIDANYIESRGAAAKGIPALEYLLFFADNQEVLNNYTSDSNAERKRDYLKGLTENLNSKAQILLNAWLVDGYAEEFKNSSSGFKIELDRLANQMLFLVERVKNAKIGEPLGLGVGAQPNTDLLEARLSENSLDQILSNLAMIKTVFQGGQGLGFDDYLEVLQISVEQQGLALLINQKIDEVIQHLNNLQKPLHQAIDQNPDEINNIHTLLQELTVLIKSDMFSALGITITFSDADGD